jgi:hypothetical protein
VRFSTLTHKRGRRSAKSEDIRNQWQAARKFVQEQAFFDRPQNIKNTLLYVQLEEALFQGETSYISKVAKTEKEICSLVEAGFEYVTEFEGSKIFRKRKL